MDKTVLTIRAITSLYAKRFLLPVLGIGVVIYIAIMTLIGWIAGSVSSWWWFLAIVPSILFIFALIAWVLARVVVTRVAPPMNGGQIKATKQFIKRIDKVAETVGTPKYIVFYRIIKDVVARPTSSKTFIGEIAQEPGEMRREFDELRSMF